MGFKKIKEHSGEQIVEIKVKDQDRSVLENWTIMMSDLGKWTSLMRKKYGFDKKKELDWAM